MISTSMLLSGDPKVPAQYTAQVKEAHRTVAEEVNTKAAKPTSLKALGLVISDPPTQGQMQTVADRLDALLALLQK